MIREGKSRTTTCVQARLSEKHSVQNFDLKITELRTRHTIMKYYRTTIVGIYATLRKNLKVSYQVRRYATDSSQINQSRLKIHVVKILTNLTSSSPKLTLKCFIRQTQEQLLLHTGIEPELQTGTRWSTFRHCHSDEMTQNINAHLCANLILKLGNCLDTAIKKYLKQVFFLCAGE